MALGTSPYIPYSIYLRGTIIHHVPRYWVHGPERVRVLARCKTGHGHVLWLVSWMHAGGRRICKVWSAMWGLSINESKVGFRVISG